MRHFRNRYVRFSQGIFLSGGLVLFSTLAFSAGSAANLSGSECGTLKTKAPIAYVPFSTINPKTGKTYQAGDILAVKTASGMQKVDALNYYNQLNTYEKNLNAVGYSLRQGGLNDSDFNRCQRESRSPIEEFIAGLVNTFFPEQSWSDTFADLNSKESANDASTRLRDFAAAAPKDPELPDIPPFESGEPNITVAKDKLEVKLDKEWPIEYEKDLMKVGAYPYFTLKANNLLAEANTGVRFKASMMGIYEGEIANASLTARTPGAGELRADIEVTVMDGKRVYAKPLVDVKPFNFSDRYAYDYSLPLEYRFIVGPVPVKAQLGIRAEAGFKWAVKLFPLQVGIYGAPWGAGDVYTQAGVDVVVGGGGLGGQVSLIKDSVVAQGTASFQLSADHKKGIVKLNADVTNKLSALDGDLYGFGYVYLPTGKWDAKQTLFSYDGYHWENPLLVYTKDFPFDIKLPKL